MKHQLLERLDRRIFEQILLGHPFYTAWKAGELTIADLRLYAGQYYQFEADFPRYLSAVHSRCPDAAVRQGILTNLWDEEHGLKNHRALWLDFCAGVGLDRQAIEQTEVLPSTQVLLDTYSALCATRPFQEGLAAIYAYEAQVPEVAAEKLAGLRDRYGIVDEVALAFFHTHSSLDVEHSRVEGEAISKHTAPAEEPAVESALVAGLQAWWGFLDGVNELRVGVGAS